MGRISKTSVEMFKSGATLFPEFTGKPYEGVYRQRVVDVAREILQIMGISREDKENRLAVYVC